MVVVFWQLDSNLGIHENVGKRNVIENVTKDRPVGKSVEVLVLP